MLINLTNHPSVSWSVEQLSAAKAYGEIKDISFPSIDPSGDEDYINLLSEEYLQLILQMNVKKNCTVHIMGEMTFSFSLIEKLKMHQIPCISSTTKRMVDEKENSKEVFFEFRRFRNYL